MSASLPAIHVWLILMKAHQALEKHAERSLEPLSICFSDFVILEALLHKGPMPINRIGDIILLTSGSLTAAADRLERKGWVTREADPTDRRTRIVQLTDAGRTEIEALFERHQRYFEALLADFPQEDRETLVTLLKRLGKHAQQKLSEPIDL
jgi:MarR family 2-MHQ and catechol resistance regulon transcriptional repressor